MRKRGKSDSINKYGSSIALVLDVKLRICKNLFLVYLSCRLLEKEPGKNVHHSLARFLC
jgi:hypothetical protein